MTTQSKLESGSQGCPVNHGPFYRSAELVAGVHRAEGGIFDTFRGAHAFGGIFAGTFTATPIAKTIARAVHFQPKPVTARFSGAAGDLNKKSSNMSKEVQQ